MFNRLMYGSIPQLSTTLGDGATAAPIFDSSLILPFWMPLSIRPMDTALDSSKLSDLRLEVTFASTANFQTAAAPTGASFNLEVASVESFGIDGAFSDCKIYPIIQQIQISGQNQIQLPVTALYRGFVLNLAAAVADSDGTGDIAPGYAALTGVQNAGLKNIKLISGTTVFHDMQYTVMRDWQRQRLNYGPEQVQTVAATAPVNGINLNIARNTLLKEPAWAFLDLVQDGYLGEGIDSVGFSELYLEVDSLTAGVLTIMPIQVFPRRTAKAAA
jgi:hypothetical protein